MNRERNRLTHIYKQYQGSSMRDSDSMDRP